MPNNLAPFEHLADKLNKLDGMAESLIKRKAKIILDMSNSQSYLDRKDEVLSALQSLQEKTQAKTKDLYESLLTNLIHDVKGYDPENHKVLLKTKMRSSKPWLDIEIENKEGFPRDVHQDKGGSIENLVAMGLRFITLSRTANRRFLVFDEADKHLNPKYVPGVAKILHELSVKVGMQVLYISHHDPSFFEGNAKIVHLHRASGGISTETLSDVNNSEFEGLDGDDISDYMEGVGIRYIRLKNIKQHENTLIELSPFVTVITGDMDLGKSTVVQAIEAINYNGGREGLIRDNRASCHVELGLEDNMTLSWKYKRRGSKKTLYELYNSSNELIQKSDSGNTIPEWLNDYLGMSPYKGFDLHISGQQNASFILESSISGHRRAEILSLGQEANQVMAMISLHGKEVEHHTKAMNRLKRDLSEVKNRLECFRQLGSAFDSLEKIKKTRESIELASQEIHSIEKIAKRLSRASSENTALKATPNPYIERPSAPTMGSITTLSLLERASEKQKSLYRAEQLKVPNKPEIRTSVDVSSIGKGLTRCTQSLSVLVKMGGIKVPNKPVLQKLDDTEYLIRRSSYVNDVQDVLKGDFTLPARPTIEKFSKIAEIGEEIKETRKEIQSATTCLEEEHKKSIELNGMKDRLIKQMGDKCIVCGNKLNNEGQHESL